VAHLEVDLVAADRKIWSGGATMVSAPAADGEVGIMPGHAPLLAILRAGEIRVTPFEGEPFSGTVTGGFLSVDANRVTIVADSVTMNPGSPTR
jgi:F-type H+-transporting ATPase subunit epsilon